MRVIVRLTVLLVVCVFILPYCFLSVSANEDLTTEKPTNESNSTEMSNSFKESIAISHECCTAIQDSLVSVASESLFAIIAEDVVPLTEYAQVTFKNDDAISYTFEGENVEILQTSDGIVTFKLQPDTKTGLLRAIATCPYETVIKKVVYLD